MFLVRVRGVPLASGEPRVPRASHGSVELAFSE